jgi:uncharacterized protein
MLTTADFAERFGRPALIGMIHLRPLPGSPLAAEALDEIITAARRDVEILESAGFDALIVENFGDRPFRKTVEPVTVAALTRVVSELASASSLPLGVNVLRNDAAAAIGIAVATGAAFIRVNIHTGVLATDQGLIEGTAAETLRLRRSLGADDIAIFADLLVKHASPLTETDPAEAALELRERGLTDAILLTGRATGAAADLDQLRAVRDATDAPLLVASGITAENAAHYLQHCDGLIVGTSLKEDGRTDAPVDPARARAFVKAARGHGEQ